DAIGAVMPNHIVGDQRVGVELAVPVPEAAGTGSSVAMAGRAGDLALGNRGLTERGGDRGYGEYAPLQDRAVPLAHQPGGLGSRGRAAARRAGGALRAGERRPEGVEQDPRGSGGRVGDDRVVDDVGEIGRASCRERVERLGVWGGLLK